MKKLNIFVLILCLFIPLAVTGCKNSNKETLSTPNILEIKGGTIVFDSIKNAEYYTISINDTEFSLDADHSNYVEIIDNKINYDASKIFVVGSSYSVKIQANSSKQNNSEFSEEYSYKHSGNIKKPTNVKINATTLTWDVVENASYYLVKIITPNDNIIFDKDGNVISQDDSSSIAMADLTEYSFNTNQFDFGSLLTKAGNYKFYVASVLSDGYSYVESGYTQKITYSHSVQLSSPTGNAIHKSNDELHLITILDSNANAISVRCDEFEKTAEINGSEQSITMLSDNLLDINLNEYFKIYLSSGKIDFSTLKQFSFSTQSKFVANGESDSFYINSEYSDNILYDNKLTLTAPQLSLTCENDNYIASWQTSNADLVGEYRLIVFTSNGLKEYKLDSNLESMLITDEFVAVAVQAIGVGNYLSSALSNIEANPTLTNNLQSLNCSVSGTTLTWNNIADYYVVEFANEYTVCTTSSFEIPTEKMNSNEYSFTITAIKDGYKNLTKVVDITYTNKLATPTISYSQGFTSSKLYELTFTGVDNAIGYYIYIKSKDATDFAKINTLYTTTAIDLSQYICSAGEYTDYEVKIKAVADPRSVYSDSELSSSVSVSHVKVLQTPEFNKINDTIVPVSKQTSGNSVKYILKFYGVEDAGSYEILINYNKLTVDATDNTSLYEVDISNYLMSANNYEIKVRAIPSSTAFNMQASDYAIANYALTKQLATVENIQVTENEGVYTLSFTPIDNAEAYRIRIVKENDGDYLDYLNNLGLSNSLVVEHSTDISAYVKQQGVYYFYVTALAPKDNSYYADAQESTQYAVVSKLTSLESPKDIAFVNVSKDSYLLNWTGDENADYYLVRLTDPNNISYEFKVYSATSTNINKYMTVQGTYNVSIYSMVNAVGTSSKEYSSSSAATSNERYIYQTEKDFARSSIYMYGNSYDYIVEDIGDLKNLLWYHYLYEIDISTGLSIMLKQATKDDDSIETIRESILRLAQEANDLLLHNFENDQEWLALAQEATTTDNDLFSYLCKQLLEIYPEFNVLENFTLDHTTGNNIFNLVYRNALNGEKITDQTSTIFTNTNYGNIYNYIDLYSRKSSTGSFKIDAREEMLVTTTEQLLQAVQHNRKPKFVGESETAETVYNNAKLVLSAIVTNNMSDLEKVTAIFNWLEYGYDLTYYTIGGKAYLSGAVEANDIATYGQYMQYYLEGIFEDIRMLSNGDLVIGNNLATSASYSKAFALLCAIEGIEAVVVNGEYTFYDQTTTSDITVDHSWNKVHLDTSIEQTGKQWYTLDLTFSDNRIYFNDLTKGYGISSHTYFLTTDSFTELNLNVKDLSYLISSNYETERDATSSYNYYANSSFALTYNQINETILDFAITNDNGQIITTNFEYSLELSLNTSYQTYAKTTGYGALQAFLLNSMIYAEYQADNNSTNKSVFEFRFNWSDNGGSNVFNTTQLKSIFDSAPNQYQLRLNLINDAGGNIYTVEDSENKTTTVIYIVEKSA